MMNYQPKQGNNLMGILENYYIYYTFAWSLIPSKKGVIFLRSLIQFCFSCGNSFKADGTLTSPNLRSGGHQAGGEFTKGVVSTETTDLW